MRTLSKEQIDQIKAVLADTNVRVIAAKSQIRGEGSPGKRPSWWHGNGSSKTRLMVRQHGYSNDRYGWTK